MWCITYPARECTGLLEEDAQHDLHSQLGPTSCSPELHPVQRIARLSLHPMRSSTSFPGGGHTLCNEEALSFLLPDSTRAHHHPASKLQSVPRIYWVPKCKLFYVTTSVITHCLCDPLGVTANLVHTRSSTDARVHRIMSLAIWTTFSRSTTNPYEFAFLKDQQCPLHSGARLNVQ